MIQPVPASKVTPLERHAAEQLFDNPTARFACWLMPLSLQRSATKLLSESCDMPSAFPLLEKDRHNAIAITHPAACVVVQGDTSLVNLFGRNAVLLRPVAEFLITAFAIDKIDINRTFIGENGSEPGIAALAICFANKQRESAT